MKQPNQVTVWMSKSTRDKMADHCRKKGVYAYRFLEQAVKNEIKRQRR